MDETKSKTEQGWGNQWTADPRQQLFLKSYLDPKSSTWGNALQSGLKAGYSQEYSESITSQMPDWLAESLGKNKIVQKAERNLDMALDGLLDDPEKGKKEIQWKASEFALERLNKKEYASRVEQEHSNPDGNLKSIVIIKSNGDTDKVIA